VPAGLPIRIFLTRRAKFFGVFDRTGRQNRWYLSGRHVIKMQLLKSRVKSSTRDDLECLMFLHENGVFMVDGVVNEAVKHGDLDMLSYIVRTGHRFNIYACREIGYDGVDVFDYDKTFPITNRTFKRIAGRADCVLYLETILNSKAVMGINTCMWLYW
jgi:hypothetical protein